MYDDILLYSNQLLFIIMLLWFNSIIKLLLKTNGLQPSSHVH